MSCNTILCNFMNCSVQVTKTWTLLKFLTFNPASIYPFKLNNTNSRKTCEICPKLTIMEPEQCHWRLYGVFIVNFKYISHLFQVFVSLTCLFRLPYLKNIEDIETKLIIRPKSLKSKSIRQKFRISFFSKKRKLIANTISAGSNSSWCVIWPMLWTFP